MSAENSSADSDRVRAICGELLAEPLFHMSLGSKELFHSNFIAWFADAYPNQASELFGRWDGHEAGRKQARAEREASHLDLVLHLPGLRSIAIENKVFSVPDAAQLAEYTSGAIAKLERRVGPVTKLLLTLMDPGGAEFEGWRVVRYADLAEALEEQLSSIAPDFDAELVRRYIKVVRQLVDLLSILGKPAPTEPFLLTSLIDVVGDSRLSAAVQKARASHVLRELQQRLTAFTDQGGVDVGGFGLNDGFSNGESLLEGFVRLGEDPSDVTKDALGWQFQGGNFRLAAVTAGLGGEQNRKLREDYVTRTYKDWFDFRLLEEAVGDEARARPKEVRSKTWQYQGYNPNFVYWYRSAPTLTSEQLITLGLAYMQRARDLLGKSPS